MTSLVSNIWRCWSVSQHHLWTHTVHQQESLGFRCAGGGLLPDKRGHLSPFSSLKPHLFGSVWKYSGTTSNAEIFHFDLEVQKFRRILSLQILDAMNQDSGVPLTQLRVDGGMTTNRLLMQLQADILCIPVGGKTRRTQNPSLSFWIMGYFHGVSSRPQPPVF